MVQYRVRKLIKYDPLEEMLPYALTKEGDAGWTLRTITDSGHDSWILVFSREKQAGE